VVVVAEFRTITVAVPETVGSMVSATVIGWLPAVVRVAVKVWTP
jgi:hypothetical protein